MPAKEIRGRLDFREIKDNSEERFPAEAPHLIQKTAEGFRP